MQSHIEKMENTNQHRITNFWFGFSMGITLSVLASFFLGTKKGRVYLKKIIDIAENIDDYIADFSDKLDNDVLPEESSEASSTLHNVIEKIKSISKNTS